MLAKGLKSNLVNPGHGSDLVSRLGEAHTSGLFADVKLVCGDGSLWAHAATLAAVSPVLRYPDYAPLRTHSIAKLFLGSL